MMLGVASLAATGTAHSAVHRTTVMPQPAIIAPQGPTGITLLPYMQPIGPGAKPLHIAHVAPVAP